MTEAPKHTPLSADDTAEILARQRGRNKVMGLILGSLAILLFAITIVKILGPAAH